MYLVRRFVLENAIPVAEMTAVSLYSGAGLSDYGYRRAGFNFHVQAELNQYRAAIGAANFAESNWIVGDLRQTAGQVIEAYRSSTDKPLDLLVATPPCQGMSSSNPGRGKRLTHKAQANEQKNSLLLATIPIIKALRPRVVVAENVRQILTLEVNQRGHLHNIIDIFKETLSGYTVWCGVMDAANYGIPQTRKRAVIVAVRNSEYWVEQILSRQRMPWPSPSHGTQSRPPVPLEAWLRLMKYQRLDAGSAACSKGKHPLHFVPYYDADRYLQISSIPESSGASAYENDTCPECSYRPVPQNLVRCNKCAALMRNRPYVLIHRRPRLIAGFHSSYRRMDPKRPAPTIMTNSSHVGSDFKIHPMEHRVLSVLECADIQTVPRSFSWSIPIRDGRTYTIRNVVGEAFPPYLTYRHGLLLRDFLTSDNELTTSRCIRRCARK